MRICGSQVSFIPILAEYQYVVEYAQVWMNGFAHLVGWVCITTFMICLVCRVYFGPDAIQSTPGRMFVLFGELLECMGHHFLEWYGEKKIKYWQGEREKFRSALPTKTNLALGVLNRWQSTGVNTSDLFRALSTISVTRS